MLEQPSLRRTWKVRFFHSVGFSWETLKQGFVCSCKLYKLFLAAFWACRCHSLSYDSTTRLDSCEDVSDFGEVRLEQHGEFSGSCSEELLESGHYFDEAAAVE